MALEQSRRNAVPVEEVGNQILNHMHLSRSIAAAGQATVGFLWSLNNTVGQMKRLLLILLVCTTSAFAGLAMPPDTVVSAAIAAAHRNDLGNFLRCVDLPALAVHPRHPLSPREALNILEKIDEHQVVLKILSDPKKQKEVIVRMTKPRVVDFEVKDVVKAPEFGATWIIVGIRP